MTALVDTNALLFALLDPSRLSSRARAILEDRTSTLLWSTASTWEVVLKVRTGKLDLGGEPELVLGEQLLRMGMRILPVEQAHALRVAGLREAEWLDPSGAPRRHADPFDRMLIAQALVEDVPIVTADEQFSRYPVERIW